MEIVGLAVVILLSAVVAGVCGLLLAEWLEQDAAEEQFWRENDD
jgi:hypothetical protein